jgi:hypothetical protein
MTDRFNVYVFVVEYFMREAPSSCLAVFCFAAQLYHLLLGFVSLFCALSPLSYGNSRQVHLVFSPGFKYNIGLERCCLEITAVKDEEWGIA